MSQALLALANLLRPDRKLAEMVGLHIKNKYGCPNLVAFNEDNAVKDLSAEDKDKLYTEWAEKVEAEEFDYFTETPVTKKEEPAEGRTCRRKNLQKEEPAEGRTCRRKNLQKEEPAEGRTCRRKNLRPRPRA